MPTFTVTDPEGQEWDVDGPEGSTEEQAIAHLQATWKPSTQAERAARPKEPVFGSISEKGSSSLPRRAFNSVRRFLTADPDNGALHNAIALPPTLAVKGGGELLRFLDAQAEGAHEIAGKGVEKISEAAPWLPPAIPATAGMAAAELASLQNWVGAPEAEAGAKAGRLGKGIMNAGDKLLPKSFQYNPRNIAGQAEGIAHLGTAGINAIRKLAGRPAADVLPVVKELNMHPPEGVRDTLDIPAFQRQFQAENALAPGNFQPLEPSLEVPTYIRRQQATATSPLPAPEGPALPTFDDQANQIFELTGTRPASAGPAGEASGEVTDLVKRADRSGDQGSKLEKRMDRQGGMPVDNNGVQAQVEAPVEQAIGTPPAKVELRPQRPRYVTVEGMEDRGPAKLLEAPVGQTFEEVQFQDGSKMRLRGAALTPAEQPPLPTERITVEPKNAPGPVFKGNGTIPEGSDLVPVVVYKGEMFTGLPGGSHDEVFSRFGNKIDLDDPSVNTGWMDSDENFLPQEGAAQRMAQRRIDNATQAPEPVAPAAEAPKAIAPVTTIKDDLAVGYGNEPGLTDVKKLSYKIAESFMPGTDYRSVNVTDKNGKLIANVSFSGLDSGKPQAMSVWVDPKYQRKGVATKMYDLFEKETGLKIIPGDGHTQEGANFWAKRDLKALQEQQALNTKAGRSAPAPKPLPIEAPKPTGKTLKNYTKQSFELLPDAEKAEVFNASSLEERKAWGKANGMQEPPEKMEAPAPVVEKAPEVPAKTTSSEIRSKLMQSADNLESASAEDKAAFEALVREKAPDVAAEFDASAKVAGRKGWWLESEAPPPLDDTFNLTGMGAEEAGLRQMQAENPEGFARQLEAESKARQAKAAPEAEQTGLDFGAEEPDTRPEWQRMGFKNEDEYLAEEAAARPQMEAEARRGGGGLSPVTDAVEQERKSGKIKTTDQMIVALQERGIAPPDADQRWLEDSLSAEQDAVQRFIYKDGTDRARVAANKKLLAADRAAMTKNKAGDTRGNFKLLSDPFGFEATSRLLDGILNESNGNFKNFKDAANIKDWKGRQGYVWLAKALAPVSHVMQETGMEARRGQEFAASQAKKFIDASYDALAYVRGNKARNAELWAKMEGNMDLRAGDAQVTETAKRLRKILDDFHAWTGRPIDQYRANYLPHSQVPGEGIQPLFKPWELEAMEKAAPAGETKHFRSRKAGAVNNYDIDLDRVLEGYFNRTAHDEVQAKLLPIWEERFAKTGYKKDSMQSMYFEEFKKAISSNPENHLTPLDKQIDNIANASARILKMAPPGAGVSRRATNFILGRLYAAYLGGRLAFPVQNLAQNRNTFSEVGLANNLKGLKYLYSPEARQAYRDSGLPYSQLLNEVKERAGTLSSAKNRGVIDSIVGAYAKADDKLMKLAEFSENLNRGIAYHAGLADAAQKGLTGAQAELYAKSVVDKTQFAMGKAEVSPLLRGSISRLAMQFTHYPTHQVLLSYNRLAEGQLKKTLRLLAYDGFVLGAAGSAGYSAAHWLGWEPVSKLPHFSPNGPLGKAQERFDAMKVPGGGSKLGPIEIPKRVGDIKLPVGPLAGMTRFSPPVQLADKVIGRDEFTADDMLSLAGVPALAGREYQKLAKELKTGKVWEMKNGDGPLGFKMRTLVRTNESITPQDAIADYFKFLPPSKKKALQEEIKLRTTDARQRKQENAERLKERVNQ